MDTTIWIAVALIVAVALVVIAVLSYRKRNRSRRLKQQFGSEYDLAINTLHSRELAEAELERRQQRVSRFQIVPLSRSDRVQYQESWKAVQARFVDSPKTAVQEAQELIFELMKKRGYPVSNSEQAADDLSADHADVVSHYRAATRIAEENQRGEAKTEELRQALVHYRALFGELLESAAENEPRRAETGHLETTRYKGGRANEIPGR